MTTIITMSDIQADPETFAANAKRMSPTAVDQCFACGRGLGQAAMSRGWFIHLRTDGTLIPNGRHVSEGDGSQGWFPLGSECAKRVPVTHRARLF